MPVNLSTWPLYRDSVLDIERSSFAPSIADDMEDFERLLRVREAIMIVARLITRKGVVGYVAGAALEAFSDIPGVKSDSSFGRGNTLYVESLAVLPSVRGQGIGGTLLRGLLSHTRTRGLTRVVAHVETASACHLGLAVAKGTVFDDWYGTGQSFQYVEFTVPLEGS